MDTTSASTVIGEGVQLFRIRDPETYFVEVAELPPLRELFVARRRVWKLEREGVWYAVLNILYKDEEEILVRAESPDWETWDWKKLAELSDRCRWRGPEVEARYLL